MNHAALATACGLAGCLLGAACVPKDAPSPAAYVGSATCGSCHQGQYEAWLGSHHFAAMQPANAQSVLGDFPAALETSGFETRFFRQDGGFFVSTQDADGERATFRITHTFGIEPLQQYLVSFPDGRRQALGIAWDSRAAAAGGQRWFALYDDTQPGEAMHWTGRGHNWNAMCADCHSTAVEKGYREEEDRFETTYREVAVGCEACHGPGAPHLAAPQAPYEETACAPCHSRRTQLREGFRPGEAFLDYYQPVPVSPPLYFADGQIRDEVYVWGSFAQSRMHAAGVVCTDCHDPHAATLRRPPPATCTHCHAPHGVGRERFPMLPAKVYDSAAHHGHKTVGCIDCHMPPRTYMRVDVRHDHRLGIPRPDLTASAGTPNPCANCHQDRDTAWAVAAAQRLFGPPAPGRAEETLAQGHRRQLAAEAPLATLAADAVASVALRARAVQLLGGYDSARAQQAVTAAAAEAAPLLRQAAATQAHRLADPTRQRIVKQLLADPVLAVRLETAMAADSARGWPAPADRALVAGVQDEYMASQRLHADQPDAHTNIAAVLGRKGDLEAAQAALAKALAIEPSWVPALLNLAVVHERSGRREQAGAVLAKAIGVEPPSADAFYAYGLWLTRGGRRDAAAAALRRAHELAPERMEYAYVHALARNGLGDGDGAVAILNSAYAEFGGHRTLLQALATLNRDLGRFDAARRHARELEDRYGSSYRALRLDIEAKAGRR